MQLPGAFALVFPCCCILEIFIITFSFSFFGLHFFPEMTATAFAAVKRINAHQFSQFQEVGNTIRFIQLSVYFVNGAGYSHVAPEFLPQFGDSLQRLLQTCFVSRHAAMIPEQLAQLAMERSDGAPALRVEETRCDAVHIGFGILGSGNMAEVYADDGTVIWPSS